MPEGPRSRLAEAFEAGSFRWRLERGMHRYCTLMQENYVSLAINKKVTDSLAEQKR